MSYTRNRVMVAPSVVIALIFAPGAALGNATADECGPGTVYDAVTDGCVPAGLQPATPSPPPPTASENYPMPGFPGGLCAPMPFGPGCFP